MTFSRIILLAAVSAALPAQEIVETTEGPIQGERNGAVWAYRSIPYAAPPIGALRWKPPAASPARASVLDATTWGPVCPQVSGIRTIGEEDCLQLNVWTPAPGAESPAPVIFWIHGGGHVQGGASTMEGGVRLYDGAKLSESTRAVVVTINYRLGPFGYLALPELSGEEGSSGNLGTLDQIAALQWVRSNIRAFGGDPNRVMISGESAGGVSVCALIASPKARGLFHAAVIQSGGCTAMPLETAENSGRELAAALGCAGGGAANCLRSKSPREILRAGSLDFNIATESSPYGSVIDGVVQVDAPLKVIERGEHSRVPVITGSNSDETSRSVPAIQTEAEYVALVRRQFPNPLVSGLVLNEYPASEYRSPRTAYVALTSDLRFICPSRRTVSTLRAAQQQPVYRYFFTHIPENASPEFRELGAWHGLDVLYLFQNSDGAPGYQAGDRDTQVESAFAAYWAALAATGDPNAANLEPWPASGDVDSYLELGSPLRTGQGIRSRQCDFWDRLLRLLQQP